MAASTQGRILFFDHVKGFGFIIADVGKVFFHISQLIDQNQAAHLQPDTLVQFRTIVRKHKETKEDQLRAQDVAVVIEEVAQAAAVVDTSQIVNEAADELLPRQEGLALTRELLEQVNNTGFSKKLIKVLAQGLGYIESTVQYEQAKRLIIVNKNNDEMHWRKLNETLFENANPAYQLQMWLDGLSLTCNYILIENAYLKGGTAQRAEIIARCTPEQQTQLLTLIPPTWNQEVQSIGEVKVYLSGIRDMILSEIRRAKKQIKVAVAWFTNHELFDVLCQCVRDGLQVQLIIINDPINNWTGGLNFQKFVDLGHERGNSKLYFSEPDQQLLHHKFCLIDDEVLLNGSYNWTYYAESRNVENCVLHRKQVPLIERFVEEFERLTNTMTLVEIVVPFGETIAANRDTHRAAVYRSNDLVAQAKTMGPTKRGLVAKLIRQALTLNPENEEAQRMQPRATVPQNEQLLREEGIAASLGEIETQRQQLQQQVAAEQAHKLQQERAAAERAMEQARQQREQARELENEQQRQAKHQQQLQEERRALEAKKQLAATEQQRLQALAQQEREAAQRQERIEKERQQNEETARRQQLEETERKRDIQRQNEEAAARRAATERELAEKTAALEASKGLKMQGGRGELRINLAWKTLDDLDLHVYDPGGNHICYSAKQATCQNSLGVLDVDANAGTPTTHTPQENIFWKENPPEGTYRVQVNNYKANEKVVCPFVVTLIPEVGEPKVMAGKTTAVNVAVEVVKFSYSAKDGIKTM